MFLFKSSPKPEKIACEFYFGEAFNYSETVYGCSFKHQQIKNNQIDQIKCIRPHEPEQSNDTVRAVHFSKCELTRVPSGLKKLFPNLRSLSFFESDITNIAKHDLEEYKDLKSFTCTCCKLKYLPGDLFENFKSLERIEFGLNKITFIEPNILDGLDSLKQVGFYENPCYLMSCSPYFVGDDTTVDDVRSYLYDRLIERYKPLQDLKSSEAKLKEQVKLLQLSERSLKQQVGQHSNQKQSIDSLKKQLASLETRIENYKAENKQLRTFGERQKHEAKESKSDKAKAIKEVQILKEVQSKLSQQVQKLKNSEAKLNSENIQLKTSKSRIEKQLQESKSSEKQLNLQIEHLKTAEKNLSARNQQLEKLKASLGYDLASFTKNESTKDFKIIIGSQEFLVHKFLLAARSPTLAQVLKNNPEVENLNLVDIPVDIFEVILKFLYTDELPGDDGTNFLSLFAAAGKLKIQKLVEHAAENLIEHVDSANALTILPLSVSFKLHDLKVKAFKILKDKYSDVKFEDEWLDNPEKMIKVVAMLKRKEEILKQFDEEFKEVVAIV